MNYRQKTVRVKNIVTSFICILLINISLFFFCSNPVAGNSSQTGNNGITVTASCGLLSGKTRSKILVSVYERNYKPYDTLSSYYDMVITDDSGKYSFSSLPPGYYNLFVQDTVSGEAAFVKNIPVFIDSVFTATNKQLCLPGYFQGQFSDKIDWSIEITIVYLQGSPFYGQIGNDGRFLIGSVPSGVYTFGYVNMFRSTSSAEPSGEWPNSENEEIGSITIYPDSKVEWNQN